jgi:hypothetical protein
MYVLLFVVKNMLKNGENISFFSKIYRNKQPITIINTLFSNSIIYFKIMSALW